MSAKTMAYEASLKAVRLAALVGTILTGAGAAEAASLKEQIVVTDNYVRLGDIFNDVGAGADTVVMEAPAPGQAGMLTAFDLGRLAKEHELDWERPAFLKRVQIVRDGISFSMDDLTPMVLAEAQSRGVSGDVQVQLYGRKQGLFLPTGATVADISFENFDLSARKDRFSAVALVPTGTGQPMRLNMTGTVEEMRSVPTLNRNVEPGEIIQKHDIGWVKVPVRRIGSRAITSSSGLVGQTVRRALRTGTPLMENEVMAPVVIGKGNMVTMVLRSGNMMLSVSGRALEDGGEGDVIRIMNNKSKQTVDARVVRPGLAEVVTSNSLHLAAM